MMTASELFSGENNKPGLNKCYYCGAFCDETHLSKYFVKDTFTNRDIVKYPQSKYVCVGCAESLGVGPDQMDMIDGSVKIRENARGMQPRMYSWFLTPMRRVAGTKAHISQWRNLLIDPPEPPFAIVLADSGQKQLIFRAPVALDNLFFSILLEDEYIEVIPKLLKDRISMCTPICAALGKPALLGDISFSSWSRFQEYYGEIESLEKWMGVRAQPLSRLAAWLSLSKEDAKYEYPGIEWGKVPSGTRGARRQKPDAAGYGKRDHQRRGSQVLFDIG
jgi:hypothetical protein